MYVHEIDQNLTSAVADAERKKQFCELKGIREVHKLLSSDTQLALLSVKILHTICFPAVKGVPVLPKKPLTFLDKCRDRRTRQARSNNITDYSAFEPDACCSACHSTPSSSRNLNGLERLSLRFQVTSQKITFPVESLRKSADEEALIGTVWKVALSTHYCEVGQVAADCLKTWNFMYVPESRRTKH